MDYVKAILLALVTLSMMFGTIGQSFADLYAVPADERPREFWCAYAEKYLEPVGNRQKIKCDNDVKAALCIRLNNYGCMWQPSRDGWPGTDFIKGNNGAHDGRGSQSVPPINNGHSVFVHPKWSIAAKFRWFYERAKNRSFFSLAGRYLPACDTQGSKTSNKGWYRSCGLEKLQPNRKYCKVREVEPVTGNYCDACNCPRAISNQWVAGTGLTSNSKAVLFNEDGKPNDLMIDLVLRNSANELGGYRPNDAVIAEGSAIFAEWLRSQN